jgi:hypothetical protein
VNGAGGWGGLGFPGLKTWATEKDMGGAGFPGLKTWATEKDMGVGEGRRRLKLEVKAP